MSLAEPTNSNNLNSNISYQERLSIDKDLFRNLRKSLSFLSPKDDTSDKFSSSGNDPIFNKERYQIAISQDGKFAVTFDTANLRIRVLENTDHRQFRLSKDKVDVSTPEQNPNNQYDEIVSKSTHSINQSDEEINKTIAYFKISESLDIEKFYDQYFRRTIQETAGTDVNDVTDDGYRWGLDISNVQNYQDKYFILVAVSRIDVSDDMKGKVNADTNSDYKKNTIKKRYERISEVPISEDVRLDFNMVIKSNEIKKGTAVYRLKLIKDENKSFGLKICPVTYYYSDSVSGICKFIHNTDDIDQNDNFTLKRFVVLNFNGIYNFEYDFDYRSLDLNTRFDYPKSIKNELKHWHKENLEDCMDKLLTCLYDKYFLVEQYKNNVQTLEVYDLAEMSLKTTPKRVEKKDKHVRKFNYNTFSVSKLQICFTRGLYSVKLYLMENGLEVVSKKFDEVEKIYSLEFIDSDEKLLIIGEKENKVKLVIWDMYNTVKAETIILENFSVVDLSNRLARTSGNILQVDEIGRVTSVLKKIENKLKQNAPKKIDNNFKKYTNRKFGEKVDGKFDANHTIHSDKEFEPIVIDKEPWVIDEYKRNSYCLYQNKEGTRIRTLQLIVGRSTVQIWQQVRDNSIPKSKLPNNGGPFLEYIWANGIPINQERKSTRLRIGEFKYKPNDGSSHILDDSILDDFYLKVYWYERASDNKGKITEEIIKKEDEKIEEMERNRKAGKEMEMNGIMEMKEKVIQRKDIIEKVSAVRRACRALEHLNKRRSFLVTNYIKIHQYEEMVIYIRHIVWRFAKCKPEEFKLLDVRHNVMKKLILGDCSHLIKLILFGDKNDDKEKEEPVIRHIPRSVSWPGKNFIRDDDLRIDSNGLGLEDHERPENDMELAIYRYKGLELKDTVVVAYLLEYYSCHATDYAGWMSTVSKALPLLFKYNYDDYARKLFRKECFANQDYFSAQDPYNIIPVEYQAKRNHNIKFRAFRIDKLQSDEYKWYNRIGKLFEPFKKIYRFVEDFDNYLEKSPLALRVVPLPEFTINRVPQKNLEQNYRLKIALNIFLFLFIPRWYKISRDKKNLLSPFSRVVRYENNDDMYDNPATEAVIDFRWQKARNFFIFLFLRFLVFAFCFIFISWEYLSHDVISWKLRNFLVALIFIFYYLAAYLLVTEFIQLYYHGPRKYVGDIFNSFDILSILLPVIVMSIMLREFQFSDGFASVESVDIGLMVGTSFSVFFLWIEFVGFISPLNIKFVLLKNPNDPKINLKTDSSSGTATNPITNEVIFNIALEDDYDVTDRNDNPFSSFPTAIMAAYFWLNGDNVQRDHFDFWVIDLFTLIASIFIVTVLQNMLIAFMSGVYEKAETKGRQALLRFRANQIADYEALEHFHFWPTEPEPKYIYYIGQSKNFQEWYQMKKDDQGEIYKDFEEKSSITNQAFKDVNYNIVSIWKFDDDNSSKIKEGNISSSPVENSREIILEEINEMKKMRKNIDNLINHMYTKFNIPQDS
ncbi:hypothetical protein RclHR1_11530001 [Rhizophagus clarus]|uniref:Ion transport domain-containing protein n=1 Tax=Rhizophagus clarus TaxID=94130 RepID=A0A2Z6QGQ7_9GLOM|nr:hypothetical protein RclHR1_11530001 [Rhizophagus clarus]